MDKAVKVRPSLNVFLDRDGVICRYFAHDFTKSWEEFEFLSGAREALKMLNQAGAKVIVISNQSGVNKGIYSAKDLQEIDRRMSEAVTASGGRIAASFYCPHTIAEACLCRKPGTGLVQKAVSELNLNLKESTAYFVGDSETDIITGERSELTTILVLSGQTVLAKETEGWKIKPDHIAPDLTGALKYIL
ncbi:MAG: HAD family hydrolase [Candidatus Omnitrophica bacterium]|nr:HAD family hydrolase [Candidatus Omnitrophota bacterium]